MLSSYLRSIMGAFEGKYSGLQVIGIYEEDLKKLI